MFALCGHGFVQFVTLLKVSVLSIIDLGLAFVPPIGGTKGTAKSII